VRKLLARLTLLLFLAGAGTVGWLYRGELVDLAEGLTESPRKAVPIPDPETYAVLSDDLESHRNRRRESYAKAADNQARAAILLQARSLLEGSLPRLMHCWLGTPWDFNGTAHEPGGGKVACGYFVSSVLQDAGFKIEWAPLAQQPSQNILGTFLPKQEMMIRVGVEYDAFLSELTASGAGVYIVGLDRHVAFLVVNTEGEIRFIHSSGASPYCVVDESRENAKVLRASRYRVSGNITANGEVLRNWLLGASFKTRRM
jgi:hypothetical protein